MIMAKYFVGKTILGKTIKAFNNCFALNGFALSFSFC
jgi:hypothetical protein